MWRSVHVDSPILILAPNRIEKKRFCAVSRLLGWGVVPKKTSANFAKISFPGKLSLVVLAQNLLEKVFAVKIDFKLHRGDLFSFLSSQSWGCYTIAVDCVATYTVAGGGVGI